MTTTQSRSCQIGGSPFSYATRRADEDLYDGLVPGGFCYGLTAVLIRTVGLAVLDLTTTRRNRSPSTGATLSANPGLVVIVQRVGRSNLPSG
jgi:hypothetical protein